MGAGGYNPELQARRDAEKAKHLDPSVIENNRRFDEQRKARFQARAEQLAKLPPVGKRPHCKQCDKEMEPARIQGFGYNGNNRFCTLRCGFRWALART